MTKLLELKDKQQRLSSTSTAAGKNLARGSNQGLSNHGDDSDSDDDDDSVDPRQLAHGKPADRLKRRFLDRLAQMLARQKSFHHHGGAGSKRKSKSQIQDTKIEEYTSGGSFRGHTAATSLIEYEGYAVVLVAKKLWVRRRRSTNDKEIVILDSNNGKDRRRASC